MKRILMVAMLVALAVGTALAAVPLKINVQGVFTEGKPTSGTISFTFLKSNGTTAVGTAITKTVGTDIIIDDKGFFATTLDTSGLAISDIAKLKIAVGGVSMVQDLQAVPFALLAEGNVAKTGDLMTGGLDMKHPSGGVSLKISGKDTADNATTNLILFTKRDDNDSLSLTAGETSSTQQYWQFAAYSNAFATVDYQNDLLLRYRTPGTGNANSWKTALYFDAPTGYVGIGAINPTHTLTLKNDGDIAGLDQIIGYNDLRFYPTTFEADPAVEKPSLYIKSNGFIGIGTKTPTATLEVNGDIKAKNLTVSGAVSIPGGSLAIDAANVSYTNTKVPGVSTVKDALDKLFYVSAGIKSFTISPTEAEKGTTASVTLSWEPADGFTITEQKINNVAISPATLRTKAYSPTATTTYTLWVSDGTSNAQDAKTITFKNKIYYGVSSNATLNATTDLTGALKSGAGTYSNISFAPTTALPYMYFMYPSAWGTAIFYELGSPNPTWEDKGTFAHSPSGDTYRIYRFPARAGSFTYDVTVQ